MKSKIRSQMIEARDSQPIPEIEDKSRLITEQFLSLQLVRKAKSIFIYNSIRGEVQTRGIIENFFMQGKTVTVPVADCETHELVVSKLKSLDELKEGVFGIPEPVTTESIPLEQVDMIVVPGIAFDETGSRIGHGFGFYDKLLRKVKEKPVIALAYEMQLLQNIPCDDHDIKVDKIVTEKRVIECKK